MFVCLSTVYNNQMRTNTFEEVLSDVLAFTTNQQGLAYHLGILVQVAYKHSCAQRSEKFFQAIKKLERNTRKYVRLKISKQAKAVEDKYKQSPKHNEVQVAQNFAKILSLAFLILMESKSNCMECIRYIDITCILKKQDIHVELLPPQKQGLIKPEPQKLPEKLVHASLEKLFGTNFDVNDSILEDTTVSDVKEGEKEFYTDTDIGIAIDRSELPIKLPQLEKTSTLDFVCQNNGLHEIKTPHTLQSQIDNILKYKLLPDLPIKSIHKHRKMKSERKNKFRRTKMQSTPLKLKRYHYNFFELFRRRKIKTKK